MVNQIITLNELSDLFAAKDPSLGTYASKIVFVEDTSGEYNESGFHPARTGYYGFLDTSGSSVAIATSIGTSIGNRVENVYPLIQAEAVKYGIDGDDVRFTLCSLKGTDLHFGGIEHLLTLGNPVHIKTNFGTHVGFVYSSEVSMMMQGGINVHARIGIQDPKASLHLNYRPADEANMQKDICSQGLRSDMKGYRISLIER